MAERETHVVDSIELGGIVTIRDLLIERQSRGEPVLRLESGDPSFSIPEHVAEALGKAIRDGHTHYTAGAGIAPLRQAIFEKLTQENRIPLKGPHQVLVTNGAMHALYIAFRALLSPGDEVIMPDPTWTETADNVRLAGGVPVRVRLEAPQYRYTAEAIFPYLSPRTRAIVVNSPHNPTGTVATEEEIGGIVRLAASRGIWVVSDEAYEHVLFDGRKHTSPASLGYQRVLSVYSFSKSYAISGLRLGYLAVDDPKLLERMTKLLRCTINGVNSATQYAGVAALKGPQEATKKMVKEYEYRRNLLWEALSQCPVLHPIKPEGAFYLWARIDESWRDGQGRRSGWALTEELIHRGGVGSAPGEVFGPASSGHIRFAFACSTEQVAAAAKLLPELLR